MSETQSPRLDDKYKSGVWYDTMSDDFCQIREVGGTIGLFTPDVRDFDEHNTYFTFDEAGISKEDAIDKVHTDMRQVPQAAVNDPVRYIESILGDLFADIRISRDKLRGVEYARTQVHIHEK